MSNKSIHCFILFLLFSTHSTFADMDAANKALTEKDYETAFKEYLPHAKEGNALAQYNLATLYFFAQGMEKNTPEAIAWYEKSAAQNFPKALYALGQIYLSGDGVPTEKEKGKNFHVAGAELGYPPSQFALALTYIIESSDLELNFIEGLKWMRLAADGGYSEAQYYLGAIYNLGEKVPQDMDKARHWYQKSAKQYNRSALLQLGYIYIYANGVERDLDKGYGLIKQSADLGNSDAFMALADLHGTKETPFIIAAQHLSG